jgi:signal transduction histidine kinase
MTQTGIKTRTVDDLMVEIASLKAELDEVRLADQGYQDLLITAAHAIGPECTAGGFGLGLWIARQLATLHGGTIAIDSTSGGGPTFIVRLPVALYVR